MSRPKLLVPERKPVGGWRLALLRAWCVLGVVAAWLVFIAGDRELHWRGALYTLAGFYAVWQVVAWILRPALPPSDD